MLRCSLVLLCPEAQSLKAYKEFFIIVPIVEDKVLQKSFTQIYTQARLLHGLYQGV